MNTATAGVTPIRPELAQFEAAMDAGTAKPQPVAKSKNIREAIDAKELAYWALSGGLKVFYCPPEMRGKHGLYYSRQVTDENGNVTWQDVQITDWVGWRSARSQVASATSSGNLRGEDDETTYEVTIVRQDGRRLTRGGFGPADSVNPDKFVDLIDAGVTSPSNQIDIGRIKNILRTFGHEDGGMQRRVSIQHTGWHYTDDGRPAFAAPRGSMTPDGPTTEIDCIPPPGSEAGALNEVERHIGWLRVAESTEQLREAAGAVDAMAHIAPDKPEIGFACVGGLIAAFLRMKRRSTVYFDAAPGSGKTSAMSCLLQFISPTGVGGSLTAFMPDSSDKGIIAATSWGRDLPFLADDFREEGDPVKDRRAARALTALVQAAYGQSGGQMATARRGKAAAKTADVFAFVTAEKTPKSATAILQRSVILRIDENDFRIKEDDNPVTQFRRTYGHAGENLANTFLGSFMKWLCQRIETYGENGLDQLRADAELFRTNIAQKYTHGRAGETVASIATGWKWLLKFAQEEGIADILPSWETIETVLRKLVADLSGLHNEGSPGALILESWVQLVEGGKLTVMDATGKGVPQGIANLAVVGWKYDDFNTSWTPAARVGGYYTGDGQHIVVTNEALQLAARAAGFGDNRSSDLLTRDLKDFVTSGTKPRQRVSSDWVNSRPRGSIIPISTLGMLPANRLSKASENRYDHEMF